jgi:hypothetical protein
MVPSGLISFHAHYELTRHLQAGPRGRHLSSWCMGLKLLSAQRSPWSPPVFRHTTKPCRTSSGQMLLTLSMKEDGKQLSEMHDTSRRSGATTSGLCIVGSSRWMIWCSGAYFPVKACTSSPHWVGPFHVTQVCRPRCVRLAKEGGTLLPNPWNIEHLYMFYP